jgi:hypothetical protein
VVFLARQLGAGEPVDCRAKLLLRPGWPDERWRSLAESAAVLLLVDPLSRCSLGVSIVVIDATDASVRVKVIL